MIEQIMIDYLGTALDVPVYAEEPLDKPDEYVLIEKVGSSRVDQIDVANMAVLSYAPSLLKAAELNEIVKQAVFNMCALDSISKVSLNSDYNFTMQDTKQYRYQAVFVITYMED